MPEREFTAPGFAISRRRILGAGVAALALSAATACARAIHGKTPWEEGAGVPPTRVGPSGWTYFTPEEASLVETLVDLLIPPDPVTPGGKQAGVAVFIDRQLAGPYGSSAALYMRPPFANGTPEQGLQSPLTPAVRYRQALAALDQHAKSGFAGKVFRDIPVDRQLDIVRRLESGDLVLAGTNGRAFFELLLANTREGFFADPVYGGNRDMAGWKMIGFPGARYDYRMWVAHHNERFPLPPISIGGRPA